MAKEISKLDEGNSRRNSTGKPMLSKSSEIVPHYLRASTGSCHDFCKYGRAHAFEEKERQPIKKGITMKSNDSQNLVETVVSTGRKKESVVKHKHSPDSEAHQLNSTNVKMQQILTKSLDNLSSVGSDFQAERKKTPLSKLKASPTSKTQIFNASNFDKQQMLTKSLDNLNSVGSDVRAERKKTPLANLKASSISKPHIFCTPNINKQPMLRQPLDNQISARNVGLAERKKTSLANLKASPSSKPHVYDTARTIKQEVSSPTEKLEISSWQGLSKAKKKNLSAKSSTSLKPKSVTAKKMSSADSSGGLNGNSDVKMSKGTGISKVLVKEVLTSPTGLVSPKHSVGRVSSSNSRKHWNLKKVISPLSQNKIKRPELKQPKNDEVQEKTLYVIKMEAESKTLESDRYENCAIESLTPPPSSSPKSSSLLNSPSFSSNEDEHDQEGSEYISESDFDSSTEDNEMEHAGDAETVDEDVKRMEKKSGMVCNEDKDCRSSKLKFRRGKVVDMQSENNGPRRLKFRRGRVLGENPNVKPDARRRSFKRRDGVDDNRTETNPETVVLKHQDVQGKKEEQGLFNNVIEETASKLVETRKSKVKALVGAFETVISLQDSKPSANTVT
ncbi:hypothetical protein FEM48_Zijuj04G0049900 [Ziziphus jujuba var. spinosa]|uniref:Calmodulin-binding domain-containing protein n=1 Tax=Ziziphus jujuba var. spinosa TaxID=714518 RepID=A0A978VHX8_ZIZJJ|nr:hypothetical protein FEM48_Zijuj04G0049900 [Ziziphus jujuba var. spinosa]